MLFTPRQIEAEALPDISESFEVDAVPYFILLRVSWTASMAQTIGRHFSFLFTDPLTSSSSLLLALHAQGHTLLTRLSGAQPAALSAALKSHAAKPSALSSSSQQPVAAKTTYKPGEQPVTGAPSAQGTVGAGAEDEEVEESEEELAKRCEELMKQSDVVLFMKGDRDTPRQVIAFFSFTCLLS